MNIKASFLGLLLLIVGVTTYGQTNKFDIGVQGSPSLTSLRPNYYLNSKNLPSIGFSGGLSFQFNFKKIISLRTNIAYERKGSIYYTTAYDMNNNPVGKFTIHKNLDFLTFPLLVRATFGKNVQFFVNAGPYFGYLIKQIEVWKFENSSSDRHVYKLGGRRFDIGVSSPKNRIVC